MTARYMTARLSRRRALVLSTAGLAALAAARPALATEAGVVSALRGAVTATRDGVARDLHVGAAVHQQDSIVTGVGARLRIALVDGSTLTLGERSQLVLSTIINATDAGGGSMMFDLLSGIVRAVLGQSPPEMFEVRGRAAVAAARSTEFVVETAADTTSVFVATGEVAVRESYGQGETVLAAGEGIDVERGAMRRAPAQHFGPGDRAAPEAMELGPVRRWGSGRIEDVMARTTVDD
jgi:ferric-dicitrate binding protein FerR (iron transport regulator)